MHHQLAALHQPVHRQAAAATLHQLTTKHQDRTDEDDHHDHAKQLYKPMYREYRGHSLT
jgi:hypothetical protein